MRLSMCVIQTALTNLRLLGQRGYRDLLTSAQRAKAVDNALYVKDIIESGCRLARGSSPQSLGTQATGLDPEGDRPGIGRHRRGGKLVDEAG